MFRVCSLSDTEQGREAVVKTNSAVGEDGVQRLPMNAGNENEV